MRRDAFLKSMVAAAVLGSAGMRAQASCVSQ
jgi:hypothetical protein